MGRKGMVEMRKVYDETGRELYMGSVIGSMTRGIGAIY